MHFATTTKDLIPLVMLCCNITIFNGLIPLIVPKCYNQNVMVLNFCSVMPQQKMRWYPIVAAEAEAKAKSIALTHSQIEIKQRDKNLRGSKRRNSFTSMVVTNYYNQSVYKWISPTLTLQSVSTKFLPMSLDKYKMTITPHLTNNSTSQNNDRQVFI